MVLCPHTIVPGHQLVKQIQNHNTLLIARRFCLDSHKSYCNNHLSGVQGSYHSRLINRSNNDLLELRTVYARLL